MKPSEVTVAITGDLSVPREEAIVRVNATDNGRYVSKVAMNTDYLIAVRFDTVKARRAAAFGTVVIDESDFNEYLEANHFPRRRARKEAHGHWPTIEWIREVDVPVLQYLKYQASNGKVTERFIEITRHGSGPNGDAIFEAFDGLGVKTFREDRVIKLCSLLELGG
jgi:hypothetical protein